MKKRLRVLFVFILLIPFFVLAKSEPYGNSTFNKTNNYIKSDNFKDRDTFLIFIHLDMQFSM